jgi:DNA-directed RNA polymerase specialized sigma24 family protein
MKPAMTLQSGDVEIEQAAFRESFEAFYHREVRSVVGLAYVLSGSGRAAEDLAQDAFLKAYRHWDRISSYDDPGGWVRRVVSNESVNGSGFHPAGPDVHRHD